ncbi:hypothetical protein [Leptospira vanthielii]|uniref:Uncharacterized protein n=2 Tax=Leptospira vanthielii TaxID=293085 RepID=A0ABY2NJA9_9LEPT|nr:hypothetical protein [Leptospira vanthielii]EMY70241.1 hypothetical protein LEP1GSC199_1233 [Leptospira vanthielii serovar Holland str. Waz Holland = ATCC 700522]TGM45642.1 hypothetical protein EHQ95_18705 [Leptospira vanthielii]
MKLLHCLIIVFSVVNCASNMLLFVDKNPLPDGVHKNTKPFIKEKVQLVIVRKGALCTDSPVECKSSITGLYPESLYSKYGEGSSSSVYGSKAYSALMKHLPKMVSNYEIRSFQSIVEWDHFRNEFKPNVMVITIGEDPSMHWSMFVSVATIAIIPGYNPIQPTTEIVYYDKNGVGKEIQYTTFSRGHVWHHLTFFGWAYIYSHIISKDMYDAYFEEVFSTAVPLKDK